jgi:hypothetical protein
MYFILYNFVQPKLNFVQPPNIPEIQFHFTGAAVTLHQHPDQLFFTNFNFQPYSTDAGRNVTVREMTMFGPMPIKMRQYAI